MIIRQWTKMCNTQTNRRQEQIIVQAAGSGNNKASETASQMTKTDWLLIALLILVVCAILHFCIRKMMRKFKNTIRQEIRLQEIQKSCTSINDKQ